MSDNEKDYTFPPDHPPHGVGPWRNPPHGYPWTRPPLGYAERYSQYWTRRFGLIPALPTSFDNGNSIYELVAWLQRAFKMLADDFANLELEFEEFKNAIIELLEVLIPQLIREFIWSKEFHDMIFQLIWEWWHTFQEDRIMWIEENIKMLWQEIIDIWEELSEIWAEINLIWEEIADMWEAIEQLQSVVFETDYQVLTYGVDYTAQTFGGYYFDDISSSDPVQGLKVSILDTFDRYLIKIETNRLRNDDPATMVQNHGATVEDVPASAIFGITFMGDWADVNSSPKINDIYAGGSTALFNIYPKRTPAASWEPLFRIDRNYGGQQYVCTFRSLNDGWNTQYTDYLDSGRYLDYGAIIYTITALKEG